ncbi:MAG: hypothetical protein ACXWUG_12340 [Polyangiales bacterium]
MRFALLSIPLVLFVAGCNLEERRTKKEFSAANTGVTEALEAMKKADAAVLKARVKLKKTSTSDVKAFVEVAHDYATALNGTVSSAGRLSSAASEAFTDSVVGRAAASEIRTANTILRGACSHDLKFDEIDTCGGAWGKMVETANDLAEKSSKYGQEWPKVRTEESMAAAGDKPSKKKSDDD